MPDYQCNSCSDRSGSLNGGIHCNLCCSQLSPCSDHCSAKIFREAKPGDLVAFVRYGNGKKEKVTLEVTENIDRDSLLLSDGTTIYRRSVEYLDHFAEPSFVEKIMKKTPEPNLFEKLTEALTHTKVSKYSDRELGAYGALKVLEAVVPLIDKTQGPIKGGYESYTWIEEKCADAFCNKAKHHSGHCDDDAFANKKWENEKTGVRPVNLSELVANALKTIELTEQGKLF